MKGGEVQDCSLVDKVLLDFQEANWVWLVVVLLVYMIANMSRAIRWKMLFEPLGHNIHLVNSFFATMLMYLTNLGIPRAGEVIRVTTISAYEDIEVEKALGTIVVDRMMDFFSFGVIVILALIFEYELIAHYLGDFVSGILSKTSLVLSILAVIILISGLLYAFRGRLKATRPYKKILDLSKGFVEGIAAVKKLRSPGRFILHTVIIWLGYYLMTFLCFYAFAPTAHLGWQEGLIVFLLGALGMIVPSPGGMGSYHFMLQTGLVAYGVNEIEGFSYANILFFTVNIFGNVLFGLIGLIVLPLFNKKRKARAIDTTETI